MTIEHHVGRALDVVRTLPDDSVDLVATSPPFLALRDYGGLEGQLGHEQSPAAFLDNLLELAEEMRRVLTPDGSIAIELGDTFSGSGGAGGDYLSGGLRDGQPSFSGSAKYATENPRPSRSGRRRARRRDQAEGIIPKDNRPGPSRRDDIDGWPLAKSLCGTPTLFAWSLAYGWNMLRPDRTIDRWRIRNLICWARSNPMPGSLADKYRPATSYITVATVSPRRWFDLDAVRSHNPRAHEAAPVTEKMAGQVEAYGRPPLNNAAISQNPLGAPPLDYWTDEYDGDTTWLINSVGSSLAHYAMWPATLAERLILSMCPPGGTVLDPFAGTGTTLAVADLHGRDAIGIDLDPANTELHQPRYDEVKRSLFGVAPPIEGQLELLA